MRKTEFPSYANSINLLQLLRNNVSVASIRNKRVPSIRIRVTIEHKGKPIEVIALVDSGAEGNYLQGNFIHKHKLDTHKLEPPVYVKNVDGTINQQGIMTRAATVRMHTGDHKEDIECAVTNIGNHDILLGTDWLAAHNPEINWNTHTIAFSRCPKECKDIPNKVAHIRQLLPDTDESEPDYDWPVERELARMEIEHLHKQHLFKYEGAKDIWCPSKDASNIRRSTISTSLAKENKPKVLEGVPPKFHKFKKVFSEEAAQRLPKHQPWDHKIDLIPG